MTTQTTLPPAAAEFERGARAYIRCARGESPGYGRLLAYICSLPVGVAEYIAGVLEWISERGPRGPK